MIDMGNDYRMSGVISISWPGLDTACKNKRETYQHTNGFHSYFLFTIIGSKSKNCLDAMKETRIRMVVNNRNVVVNDRLLILFYFLLLVILGTVWVYKADIHLNQ